MDNSLRGFLIEISEHLGTADNWLVRSERASGDARIRDNTCQPVRTIMGTCGLLELPWRESRAHAGEDARRKPDSPRDLSTTPARRLPE